jgi:peptide deformylase
MALLPILHYPDPRLHTVAKPVAQVNDDIRQLVKDMAETMYDAPGIGLAATQVNVHQQVIVIDLSDERDQLQVFINPEIIWSSEEKKVWQEGCLSVPDFYDEVLRPSEVKVRALNLEGKQFELHADGLMAVCIQHEIDHLKGKVFVEYLSSLKRMRIASKLKKKSKAGVI